MSGANYALCGNCHTKTIYVGEADHETVYCAKCFEQLQTRNKRLKEELESMLYQFAGWNDAKGGFTTNGLSALESAFDVLGWNDPHIHKFSQCDELGCKKRGTCGWGPKDKRRHTCSTHWIEATRKEE